MAEFVCTVNRVDNGFIVSNGEITVVGLTVQNAINTFYEVADSKNQEIYKHGMTRTQYNNVVNLIKGGNFINGIKEIREITGMGLREAKDIADDIRDNL